MGRRLAATRCAGVRQPRRAAAVPTRLLKPTCAIRPTAWSSPTPRAHAVGQPGLRALAQLSAEDQARGQPLDRWLGRTGVELGVLIANLRQRGSVGLFTTTCAANTGRAREVEISASRCTPEAPCWPSRCATSAPAASRPETAPTKLPRSAGELTELVGRVPLKDIVSETTDLIEQLCIETALQMTSDNRASAAQTAGPVAAEPVRQAAPLRHGRPG
jgi:hypothetical protein